MNLPVVLFAYNRPDHLRRTLSSLRDNRVPLIYAFSDGPRTADVAPAVAEVRYILHGVDWCDTIICERAENLGLGRSIRAGVTSVLEQHPAALVFEDDLICVPGTYDYLCAALEHYQDDQRVMSVTGWTHPRVTPADVGLAPYFDGRAECLVWGTWARAWRGMDQSAEELIRQCQARGIDVYRYGADLPAMATIERSRNIWAVRWLYLHILRGGLSFRPPYSLVEHIGFDLQATNASDGSQWANPLPPECPPLPQLWPDARENKQCSVLWRREYGGRPRLGGRLKKVRDFTKTHGVGRRLRKLATLMTPPAAAIAYRRLTDRAKSTKSPEPEWEYLPDGWRTSATDPRIKGWDVPEVVAAQAEPWEPFVQRLSTTAPFDISPEAVGKPTSNLVFHNTLLCYAYVLALATRHMDSASILDWGGGLGYYYLMSRRLNPTLELDYHCREVGALARRGQTLLPEVHFHTDDSCLRRQYDLVLASCSLHYSKDWRVLLGKLILATSGHLFVTRLPITQHSQSFVFVQRPYAYGYNTEYVGWCLNREEFSDAAIGGGLELVREFVTGEQPPIVGAPEQCEYRGYLFRPALQGAAR